MGQSVTSQPVIAQSVIDCGSTKETDGSFSNGPGNSNLSSMSLDSLPEKHDNQAIAMQDKITDGLDRIGIALSTLCAVHCVLTPIVILSLPIMARFYVAHPWFHYVMALLIVPVGVLAFVRGYRHHHNLKVLALGIPGLFLVGIFPMIFHSGISMMRGLSIWTEPTILVIGSVCLIVAHWNNRRSCACADHHH